MLQRYFTNFVGWMNGAGVVWVFALMFLICADITGRTVFDSPIRGVTEMVSLSLVACVFLQIAYAIHRARLTRAEVVVSKVEARQPVLANDWSAVLFGVGCLMFALLAVGAWPDFIRAARTGEFAGVEGIFTIPVWPIKMLLVVGALVAALECLRQLIGRLVNPVQAADGQASPLPRPLVFVVPLVIVALIAFLWLAGVEQRTVGAVMIAIVLLLIALGMPIAIALLLVGFVGLAVLKQDFGIATRTLALAAEGTISEYVFAAVPLFVLMGLFVNASDIGRDAFRAAQRIFGWIYGGLGVATVAANALFAAITGISIASAAIFSKIAVPEMVRQGYTAKFAVGLTAGSSVLGMLIPPSLLLILFGILAETSIGDLFIAGIVPGLLLAAAYCVLIWVMAHRFPDRVAARETLERETRSEMSAGEVCIKIAPIALLILIVLGGIYGGVFTATEAGAVGALGAMILTLLKRKLTWKTLWEALSETGHVTAAICFLLIAAQLYSRTIAMSGVPNLMEQYILASGLGYAGLLAVYIVVLILLGTILDAGSIMLITVPLAVPALASFDIDLVWFGIVTIIAVEIGLLTPPLGLACFVIHNNLQDRRIGVEDIFWGAAPFALTMLVVLILVTVFPWIALALV